MVRNAKDNHSDNDDVSSIEIALFLSLFPLSCQFFSELTCSMKLSWLNHSICRKDKRRTKIGMKIMFLSYITKVFLILITYSIVFENFCGEICTLKILRLFNSEMTESIKNNFWYFERTYPEIIYWKENNRWLNRKYILSQIKIYF